MNKYYVYVYMDSSIIYNKKHLNYYFKYEPFYIGKGCDLRYNIHLYEAKRSKNTNNHKINKIKKLLSENHDIIIEFIQTNLNEAEAYDIESKYIIDIGRRDLNTGPLCNLYDKQGVMLSPEIEMIRQSKTKGHLNGMYGKTHSDEVKKLLSEMKKQLVGEKAPRYGKVSPLKGKTYEELYGLEKAKELKKTRSINMSEYKKLNPKKGFKHSEKTKIKMSENKIKTNIVRIKLEVINTKTNVTKIYNSIKELIEEYQFLTRYKISKILNNEEKNSTLLIRRLNGNLENR